MAAKPELDLRVDFAKLTPDLEVSASVVEMARRAFDQVLEDSLLLVDAERNLPCFVQVEPRQRCPLTRP